MSKSRQHKWFDEEDNNMEDRKNKFALEARRREQRRVAESKSANLDFKHLNSNDDWD